MRLSSRPMRASRAATWLSVSTRADAGFTAAPVAALRVGQVSARRHGSERLFFRSCKRKIEDSPQCIRTDNQGRLHSFGPLPYALREENRSVRSSHARTDGQVSRQHGREE